MTGKNNRPDIIVDYIYCSACNDTLTMVVYDHPIEYPDLYVARLFGVRVGATNIVMIDKSLRNLETKVKKSGFAIRLNEYEEDDEKILEVWVR
ncbi:MAG: hypothetical protein Q4B86_07325 [Eubacteriales bacterium]|nr:hypothetical protein [Eubacteriales bacterium]